MSPTCIHCHQQIVSPARPDQHLHFTCAYERAVEDASGGTPHIRRALQDLECARAIAERTGNPGRAALLEGAAQMLRGALEPPEVARRAFHQATCATCEDGAPLPCPDCGRTQ